MIPIFMPLPAVAKFGPQSLSAPICSGPATVAAAAAVSRRAWKRTFGHTSATPGIFASSAAWERGRYTAIPSATRWYRQRTCASGSALVMRVASAVCAEST